MGKEITIPKDIEAFYKMIPHEWAEYYIDEIVLLRTKLGTPGFPIKKMIVLLSPFTLPSMWDRLTPQQQVYLTRLVDELKETYGDLSKRI